MVYRFPRHWSLKGKFLRNISRPLRAGSGLPAWIAAATWSSVAPRSSISSRAWGLSSIGLDTSTLAPPSHDGLCGQTVWGPRMRGCPSIPENGGSYHSSQSLRGAIDSPDSSRRETRNISADGRSALATPIPAARMADDSCLVRKRGSPASSPIHRSAISGHVGFQMRAGSGSMEPHRMGSDITKLTSHLFRMSDFGWRICEPAQARWNRRVSVSGWEHAQAGRSRRFARQTECGMEPILRFELVSKVTSREVYKAQSQRDL